MRKLSRHERMEAQTLKEAKKIENLERKILQSEKKISRRLNRRGIKALARDGLSKKELGLIRKSYLRRFTKHKLILGLIAILGGVLIWRGAWNLADITPVLQNNLVSISVGVFLLWLINKLAD